MAVRDTLPDSIAFALELRFPSDRAFRVTVTLDLLDRWIYFPSGIFPDLNETETYLEEFLKQVSAIASNQWAYTKWDGSDDRFTEYQKIHIYAFYQIDYESLKFNISLEGGTPISIDELVMNSIVQL